MLMIASNMPNFIQELMNKEMTMSMPRYYRLEADGKTPVQCKTGAEVDEVWKSDRHVADTYFTTCLGRVRVSTVFLIIDHCREPNGTPILWETKAFGGKHDGAIDRYSTYDLAVAGHKLMVDHIKKCEGSPWIIGYIRWLAQWVLRRV